MPPTLSAKKFGEFIGRHREARGLSQKQLAEAAGISRPYLTQIENGARLPSDDVTEKLVILLGVPFAQFIDEVVSDQISDEQAEALKKFTNTYDALTSKLPPEEMLTLVQNTMSLEQMAAAMQPFANEPLVPGPEGWLELTAEDRRLVQRMVNRMRKDYDAKEAADNDDSAEA